MNVWLKSLKNNKYKNRFSTSTVSALSKSQLEVIPQTQQNSSQDNTTLQSLEQGKKKQNIFKGNIVTSTLTSGFKQVDQDRKLYPRSDHFQKKKKVSLNLEPRAINQPSSYNSELMRFQKEKTSSNHSDSENSQQNYLNERNRYNYSYKERSSRKLSNNTEQEYFTTSSITHEIGRITKEGNFISSLKKKSAQQQYIQTDPASEEAFNKFKQKISKSKRFTEFKTEEAKQRINQFKKRDFQYEQKKQVIRVRQLKKFQTEKNQKNSDFYFSTSQDRNQNNKNILGVKNKRINFLSSFNQGSSLSRQNSSSSRDQYLNTGRSRQSSYNYRTGTQKSSKQANINSKSIRPTTGTNIQHLKQYTICIIEYCSKQVGLACYNNNTGEIVLSQIIQNMTYFKTISTIQTYYPIQIIYSQPMEKSLLMKRLMQKFKKTTFRPVNRRNFDETKGFYLYKQKSNKSQYNPNNKFIAYASFNALILYLESFLQSKLKYQILQIKWHHLQQVLAIQSQTITDLQIFTNFQTKKTKNSFIQNFKCRTYGGTRMLRANILQPSSCQKIIFERQQLTQKLLQNQNIFNMLQKEIIKFRLYEPVTSKFIQNPKQQHLKSLKVFLSSILLLSHQCFELKNFQSKLVNSQAANLPIICELKKKLQSKKLQELRDIIKQYFNQQILQNYEQVKNKKDKFIFLFKLQKIQDQFAQVTRITYSQTIDNILQIFQNIKAKSKQDLKLLYNDARGYYISAKRDIDLVSLSQKLKENIVHISKRGRMITFSTSILASLNNRLKESQKVLILQSESTLRKVICQIQQNIDILFQINHFLSTVDMIMSFTGFILKNNHTKFVKPTFCRGSNNFSVINLNPVWFHKNHGEESPQDNKQALISFQNSFDKSIFCYQKEQNSFEQQAIIFSMGYTVILSQIGCFVPAESVNFELFDSLISKIKLHQTIQMNMSRFQLTISHFSNIFQNCTTNSQRCLILIDQLVKGTQHTQQCALSMAFVQQFQKNRGTTIILSSDRMLLSLLTKFRKVKVELSKRGINCKERYQQMNKWINKTLQKFNFDKDFINFYNQLNVEDQILKQFEEVEDLANTKTQDYAVFKTKKNKNKMHQLFDPQNFVKSEKSSQSQNQVESSQK